MYKHPTLGDFSQITTAQSHQIIHIFVARPQSLNICLINTILVSLIPGWIIDTALGWST